jgi:hypothetical protein
MFVNGFTKTAQVKVIKTLGKGGEGIAHLVRHPKHGLVVRKTYNITGKLFSKPLFEKKLEILRKVKSPLLAKFYGQEGNKPITYHEYVRFNKKRAYPTVAREKAVRLLNRQVREATGVGIKDLASDNFVKDKQGNYKAIDFLIDGPLSRTSRRGQLRHVGKGIYEKAMKAGLGKKQAVNLKRSAIMKMRGLFDQSAIKHKSRREIMRNALLPRHERDKLVERATRPGVNHV